MPATDISAYEGLALSTARMYYQQVGVEFEDLAQDIRLKIVKVLRTYDPTRSRLTERAHVFQCVVNYTKDLKRDAARRKKGLLTEVHIEDYRRTNGHGESGTLDLFEFRYQYVDAEQIYGGVEEGEFVMPADVTEEEANISRLLIAGFSRTEVAAKLGAPYDVIDQRVRSLRRKFMPEAA